ncbi:uncharacterized protein G2W53_003205 [Senna tora]|uniref:Uncharacterized protein n=1 Tax=Senna tora TaxID=362788 RepID=A0A834XAP1_9FABA|nr:uncharacterized protein G2W53_003205 [Senna tora]
MGTCASSQFTSKGGNFSWKSRVNIVHYDGKLQQWRQPLKAEHVLSQNPNCFICSSECMYIGSLLPHELGALAIKANAALLTHSILKSSSSTSVSL